MAPFLYNSCIGSGEQIVICHTPQAFGDTEQTNISVYNNTDIVGALDSQMEKEPNTNRCNRGCYYRSWDVYNHGILEVLQELVYNNYHHSIFYNIYCISMCMVAQI